jgi:hypothetical protein
VEGRLSLWTKPDISLADPEWLTRCVHFDVRLRQLSGAAMLWFGVGSDTSKLFDRCALRTSKCCAMEAMRLFCKRPHPIKGKLWGFESEPDLCQPRKIAGQRA